MPDAYVIEIDDNAAGIVARQPGERHYSFYASDALYRPLESTSFASVAAAQKAAARLRKEARPGPQQVRAA
jgi:hypothetical protein